MKRTIALALTLAFTLPAAAAPLTADEVHAVAAVMFETYQAGGASAMYAEEMDCWDGVADMADDATAEKAGATCATAAITGFLIERAFAMKQIRGEAGEYRADAMGARLEEQMRRRFTDAQLDDIGTRPTLDAELLPNIITGLMAAGMP